MFTFSNPFFAYIKYTEVYFKRGKYLKKKKKVIPGQSVHSQTSLCMRMLTNDNVLKCYDFCFWRERECLNVWIKKF